MTTGAPHVMRSEIRAELVRRELAIRKFAHFLRYRFLQERRELHWNWHLDYLCEIMEAVYRRDERRVLVNMPFRSLKTETIEQSWQAWMILQEDSPRSSVLSAAAEYTLAVESSGKTLEIVSSTWFTNLAGRPLMDTGKRPSIDDWRTVGGARRQALGIGGQATGKGADHLCVAGGSLVLTRRGDVPIEDVIAGDAVATPIGWRRVRSAHFTGVRDVVRLESGGRSLWLTPDHRCSSPDGWRQAGAFRRGDCIHAMEEASSYVPRLRQRVHGGSADDSALFSDMRHALVLGTASTAAEAVPILRQAVHASEQQREAVLARLLRQGAGNDAAWLKQPGMAPRQARRFLSIEVQEGDRAGDDRGATLVLDVSQDDDAGGSPHRRESQERHAWQSSGVVRPVSSRIASADAAGTTDVYDLQVEEAHAFYANGFLVHNCWGDILKPEDANSDRKRSRTCAWLGETFRSRLNNLKTGTIVGVMQRLHELDPTGYLLERMKSYGADQWLHVKIEMECARKRIYTFGEFFYERQAGELLHPDRIGPAEIAALKVDLGNNYEGQANQNPIKMKGSYYQTTWFNEYDGPPPTISHTYQVWDYALSEESEESGDYSVCITFGLVGDRLYLVDLYRARIGSVDVVEQTMAHAIRHKVIAVFGAKGPIDKAIRPWLSKRMAETGVYFRLEGIAETVDIVARSTAFQSMCRNGNVYIPKTARWLADFKLEFSAFPKGAYDDQAAAAAIIGLALPDIRAGEIIPDRQREMTAAERADLDRNLIRGADIRKAVGRRSLPSHTLATSEPVRFAVERVKAGCLVTRISSDDYHSAVRQALLDLARTEAEAGRSNIAAMASGEVGRLDRRFNAGSYAPDHVDADASNLSE